MATPKNRGESRGSERERGFSNIQQPEDSEIRRPTLLSMASVENPAGLLHCFPHLHPASILQILAKSIPQGTRHERIVGFKTSKTCLVQGHLGGSVMKVQLLISARVTISVLWEPAWGSLLPSPFAPSPLCVLSPFLKKKKKNHLKIYLVQSCFCVFRRTRTQETSHLCQELITKGLHDQTGKTNTGRQTTPCPGNQLSSNRKGGILGSCSQGEKRPSRSFALLLIFARDAERQGEGVRASLGGTTLLPQGR